MKYAQHPALLLSPVDRLTYTLSPSDLKDSFNLDSTHSLFVISGHKKEIELIQGTNKCLTICNQQYDGTGVALVDISRINLESFIKQLLEQKILTSKDNLVSIQTPNHPTDRISFITDQATTEILNVQKNILREKQTTKEQFRIA